MSRTRTLILSLRAVLILFLLGCGSVDPIGAPGTDPFEADEERLWKTAREEQHRLDRSGAIYDNPAVVRYVNEVLARVAPPQLRSSRLSPQAKILTNPLLNAFAYPNGVIYIHTGILARMDNEAQLATLLGHELTHATHRHAIQQLRGVQRSGAALSTFQVIAMPFGIFGLAASSLGAVGHMAAVTGYSRGREAEADREGLALLVQAGYAPKEAPKLFEHLKRDLEFRKIDEPFFFGSHPRLAERIDSYQDLIEDRYPGASGEIGQESYERILLPLFVENAKSDLAIGRFELADESLDRVLRRNDRHAEVLYLMGEVARQRNGTEDLQRSEQRYRQAIAADAQFPDAHKALGMLLFKRGERDAARTELRQYLRLSPQAPDREYIQQDLNRLR